MSAWARLRQRILGYQPVGRWRLYAADPAVRGAALPPQIPVPQEVARQWGRRQGGQRLPFREVVAHAQAFCAEQPAHRETTALRRFLEKAPLALEVEDALREERLEDAERRLAAIERLDPEDARAGFLRALCLTARGQLEAAAEIFSRLAPRLADEPDFHAAHGRYWVARGEAERAEASYRCALALEPGHLGALEGLAALGEMVEIFLGTIEAPERAFLPRDAYEELLEREWREAGREAPYLVGRSHFHLKHGQAGVALRAAVMAQEVLGATGEGAAGDAAGQPGSERAAAEAVAAECRALIARERFEEAGDALARLDRLAPESAWAASCRGQWLWFRGEREAAAGAVAVALDRDPNRPEDWRLYLDPTFPRDRRDPLEALKAFIKQSPEAYYPKYVLASFLVVQERWPEALEWALAAVGQWVDDEALVELTGRLGRAGRDAEIGRIVEHAGGWDRFLKRDALLRNNVAAAAWRRGAREAAVQLWTSVAEEEGLHPRLRLQARAALARLAEAAPGGARGGGVVH